MQPIYQVWIVVRAVQSPFKLTCLDSNVDSLILRCALLRSRLFPSFLSNTSALYCHFCWIAKWRRNGNVQHNDSLSIADANRLTQP